MGGYGESDNMSKCLYCGNYIDYDGFDWELGWYSEDKEILDKQLETLPKELGKYLSDIYCGLSCFTKKTNKYNYNICSKVVINELFFKKKKEGIHKLDHEHNIPGYVYFMKAKDDNLVKIGASKNPSKRKEQIERDLVFEIELINKIHSYNSYLLEKKLHQIHKPQRINGEWFALTDKQIEDIRNYKDKDIINLIYKFNRSLLKM